MRLFRDNKAYRKMIWGIISFMGAAMDNSYDNYTDLCGISGANVGIPLNIIIINADDVEYIMLNPRIVSKSEETRIAKSNCGSLNLPEPIKVERHKWVRVEYYDEHGEMHTRRFEEGAGTIQHEIEHNLGIMIIDKEIKE